MDKITFTHNLHADILNVLSYLCTHLQNEYDISPEILNYFFNQQNFVDYCKFLHQQCYVEMLNDIRAFKDNFDMAANDITPEEYEKCGYLITSHQNTYISYCNYHKYLHPHPNIPLTNNKTGQEIIDHKFVTKTNNQIIKERYNTTIHLLYQNFINKLYYLISHIFKYLLEVSSDYQVIKISDDFLSEIVAKMKDNKNMFKSKVIYEHITQSKCGETPEKFYYVKVFQLRQH
jgi:hypothetical protein